MGAGAQMDTRASREGRLVRGRRCVCGGRSSPTDSPLFRVGGGGNGGGTFAQVAESRRMPLAPRSSSRGRRELCASTLVQGFARISLFARGRILADAVILGFDILEINARGTVDLFLRAKRREDDG